jgi:hypothetical protein
MSKPYFYLIAFLALSVLAGSRSAVAQRRGGGAHVHAPRAPAAQGNAAAAQLRQMQKQEQQYQKAMMQQQAQMAKKQHPAQKQRPHNSQGTNGNSAAPTHPKKGNPRPQSAGTQDAQQAQNAQGSGQSNKPASAGATSPLPANGAHPNASTAQPNGAGPQAQASAAGPTAQLPSNPQTASTTGLVPQGQLKSASSTSTNAQPPQNLQQPANPSTVPTTTTSPTTGAPVATGLHARTGRGIGGGVGMRRRLPGTMDQTVISHLRTAHSRLQQADHDYQGHRVRAANHVATALRHLGAPTTGSATNPGAGRMPQAQSDGLLRDALLRLNTAQTQLATRGTTAAHHGSARSQVTAAIGEINTALNIR